MNAAADNFTPAEVAAMVAAARAVLRRYDRATPERAALTPEEAMAWLRLEGTGERQRRYLFDTILAVTPEVVAGQAKRSRARLVNLDGWRQVIASLRAMAVGSTDWSDAIARYVHSKKLAQKLAIPERTE